MDGLLDEEQRTRILCREETDEFSVLDENGKMPCTRKRNEKKRELKRDRKKEKNIERREKEN